MSTSYYDTLQQRKAFGDISNRITTQSQNTVNNQKTTQRQTIPKEMSGKRNQRFAPNKSYSIEVCQNIVEFDLENTQLVSENAKEMYPHLKKPENKLRITVRQPL